MFKYKSKIISEDDIKIETDRDWNINDERVDVVKLTMLSTGINSVYASSKGQLNAYNYALKMLEQMYLEWSGENENI